MSANTDDDDDDDDDGSEEDSMTREEMLFDRLVKLKKKVRDKENLYTRRFHSQMKTQLGFLTEPGQWLQLRVESSLAKDVFDAFTADSELPVLFDLYIECCRPGCTSARETTPASKLKFERLCEQCYAHYFTR